MNGSHASTLWLSIVPNLPRRGPPSNGTPGPGFSAVFPGGVTQFGYDEIGNVTSITDPRNQVVRSAYDDAGRLAREQMFPSPNAQTPSRTITYAYNHRGELVGYDDCSQSAIYGLDALGRTESSAVNFGPFVKGAQYTYYRNGLVRTFTGPDAVTYGYAYDANKQLRSLDIPGEGKITYNAYRWSVPTQITLPGGTVQAYEYDDFLRLSHLSSRGPAGDVILDQRYTRDASGRITEKITEHGTYRYGYDDAYQLISAESPVLPNESYVYDAAANRLPADHALQASWHYNADNELLSTDTATYEYDEAGNRIRELTASDERRYFWDEQSRLVRVEAGDGTVIARYGYDPFGRRAWKEVGSDRTYFYYAHNGLLAEIDASGVVRRSFGYEPSSQWTTAPLFLSDGRYSYYHNDYLGTPQELTDTRGTVVWSAKYSGYGVSRLGIQDVVNPFRYPGQYFDEETGLLQNWHRYYAPDLGRYVQPDPSWGMYQSDTNLYAYVGNNPISDADPTGLAPRPLPHDRTRTRLCKATEYALFALMCGTRGVESCRVSQVWRVLRWKGGMTVWGWKDGPMSCSCNDPEPCAERSLSSWRNYWWVPLLPFLTPWPDPY